AGFLLLPVLGMQKAIFLAVALNLGVGLLLIHLSPEPSRIRGWVTGGSLALITIGFLSGPTWDPLSLSSEIFGKSKSMELLFYKEGLNAAVTVAENPTLDPVPHLTMAIDGKANASTAGDMPTQVLVAQIPLLLAPNPERAFVVGLGSGITVGSAAQHPLREITVAELEPAVVEGSHYFDDFNHRPLADPRIRLLVDDARNYLLVTPETFDVIISEPSHPWRSGSAKLFTKEFFELGRRRLAPNGLFAQWIHFYGIKPRELKGIIRTFHVVFPEVLVFYTPAGDLILLGSVEPIRIDPERIGKRMGNAKVSFELGRIKVDSIYDLFAYFILGTKEVEAYLGPSGPLNTDDDTFVEFQTPKSLFEDTLAIHLAEMNRYSTGAAPYLIGPEGDGEQRAEIEADMAEAYQKKDRLEDAERAIRRALTLHPSADGFRRLALILEARGREDDAMGAWTSALGLDPNHRESLMDLTRFEQERGDLKEMARYLDRWRRAHPQDPLVSYYQGIRLYYDGHAADALRELDRIGPIGGPLADYYRSLALVKLSRKGDAEAALNHFFEGLNLQRKLLEENPKNFNKLPIIKAEKMRAARGVRIPEEERLYQLFNRIVGDPLNHFYSGMGLYMLGYFKESADELSQGLKLLGERRHGSLGEFYLALAYKKMGRYKEAIEQLQSFLDAGGDGGFRLAEAKRDIEEILKRQGRTGKA
ncbi:MAG TPA: fused MFS/spermidine synthase, partial [Nitrospiria bacterium]|nr:fused MFS/spermidine synthase [Nitrospiria bacterium]